MEPYVIWLIAALVLVGAEMLTGTFYLLVVGVGVASGGAAAWLGAYLTAQFIVAAAVGLVGVALLNRWKAVQPVPQAPEQSLDVGASVQVERWNEDGTARVLYRGTQWDARAVNATTPRTNPMYIQATETRDAPENRSIAGGPKLSLKSSESVRGPRAPAWTARCSSRTRPQRAP